MSKSGAVSGATSNQAAGECASEQEMEGATATLGGRKKKRRGREERMKDRIAHLEDEVVKYKLLAAAYEAENEGLKRDMQRNEARNARADELIFESGRLAEELRSQRLVSDDLRIECGIYHEQVAQLRRELSATQTRTSSW